MITNGEYKKKYFIGFSSEKFDTFIYRNLNC